MFLEPHIARFLMSFEIYNRVGAPIKINGSCAAGLFRGSL